MHSNLTLSSLLIGPSGSGTLTKIGPPKIIKFYFIKKNALIKYLQIKKIFIRLTVNEALFVFN